MENSEVTISPWEYQNLLKAQKRAIQIFLFLKLKRFTDSDFTEMKADDLAKGAEVKQSTLEENLRGLQLVSLIQYHKPKKNRYAIKLRKEESRDRSEKHT